MRYEFIVRDCVPPDVQAELPEFSSSPFSTGGTALCAHTIDQSDLLTWWDALSTSGFLSSRCDTYLTKRRR